MRHFAVYAAVAIVSVALPAAALARGGGGSKAPHHSDLNVGKSTDKSSPKVLDAKAKGKFKPNEKRFDPNKTYKFR